MPFAPLPPFRRLQTPRSAFSKRLPLQRYVFDQIRIHAADSLVDEVRSAFDETQADPLAQRKSPYAAAVIGIVARRDRRSR